MDLYRLFCQLLNLFVLVLFAWIVLSWIRVPYDHPIGKVHRFLDRIVMPVVLPLRRVIPPLNLGGISLDLSVLLIFIVISIIC
ncbi:MAG: YggT family protein [Acidimicrobiia bacterium]|nr:YggT family protein [Acidimicrobiia bacterium]MDH5294698.1 YggT family protein [Acidimicrobiia bacterium]